MYVVWKKRDLQGGGRCGLCGESVSTRRYTRIPLLVASRRVGGKPRQVHVARFPSIRNCCIHSESVRQEWWEQVGAILESLGRANKVSDSDTWEIRRKLSEAI